MTGSHVRFRKFLPKFHISPLVLYLFFIFSIPVDSQTTQLLSPNKDGSSQQSLNGLNTFRRMLDTDTGLTLDWTINRSDRTITFTIESRSISGYIALALTKGGILEGGDVVVVGVGEESGISPVLDMYGVDNTTIAADKIQDWRLVSSSNSGNGGIRTTIERSLDTCDGQDMPIEEEQITILYAYGDSLNTVQKFHSEGQQKIYFFDPFILPESSNVNESQFQQWRLSRRIEMPPRPTSYWCSIHKMTPSLPTKHHITGFNIYFADELAKRHVHHQIVYRCVPPPGADADKLFGPFLDYPGEECYVNADPVLPSPYCREMVHIFAIGGEAVFFPESVGIALGGGQNSYFMFEAHYDNPDRTAGLMIENGVDFYYSAEIRRDEGSIIFIGQGALGTFIVPPLTSNFNNAGHCSKECTARIIPSGGMDIGAVSLHAHTSTQRMRFRHFRGNNELPWIINDDEYDFQYQQIRMLESPRRVMPGDQLTVECGYDTHWKNGSAVASGFSTRDEMCMIFLLVSKPLPIYYCTSEYNTDRTMSRFGIRNMTWDLDLHERVINDAVDPTIIGLTLSQVVEGQNWTPQNTEQLEKEQMYSKHSANCPNTRLLGGLYFYGNVFRNLTGGLIPVPMLDQGTPNVESIRTPFPSLFSVRFPQDGEVYVPPPSVCPTRSMPQSLPNINSDNIPGVWTISTDTVVTSELTLGL